MIVYIPKKRTLDPPRLSVQVGHVKHLTSTHRTRTYALMGEDHLVSFHLLIRPPFEKLLCLTLIATINRLQLSCISRQNFRWHFERESQDGSTRRPISPALITLERMGEHYETRRKLSTLLAFHFSSLCSVETSHFLVREHKRKQALLKTIQTLSRNACQAPHILCDSY